MSRLGQQISSIRISKGMTRKQLAKAIGAAEKYIEEVESGKKAINDDMIRRISKALEHDISSVMTYEVKEEGDKTGGKAVANSKTSVKASKPEKIEINDLWGDAFGAVLKEVPVYEYDLEKVKETRKVPVVSNKIEGHQKDKVLFIRIMDDDMSGFRIRKGDIAFGYFSHELESNSFCLIEYKGGRMVRQLKRLDSSKVLIVSNGRNVMTETADARDINILARLLKLEIEL